MHAEAVENVPILFSGEHLLASLGSVCWSCWFDSDPPSTTEQFWVWNLLQCDQQTGRNGVRPVQGTLFLSSVRVLLIAAHEDDDHLAIPLQSIAGERFEQPLFGANVLMGTCDDLRWAIEVGEGNVGIFLSNFFQSLYRLRTVTVRRNVLSSSANGVMAAYADPDNPFVYYIPDQPEG